MPIEPVALRRAIDTADRAELLELYETLSALTARAHARLLLFQGSLPHRDGQKSLLTAGEAARVLGVSPKWLYRRAGSLPFARRLGGRTVRFDVAGLEAWAKAGRER